MLRKPRPKGRFFAWRTAAAIKIVEAGANLVALLEIKPAAARNHFLYLIALRLRFACPLKFFIYKLVSDDPVDKSPASHTPRKATASTTATTGTQRIFSRTFTMRSPVPILPLHFPEAASAVVSEFHSKCRSLFFNGLVSPKNFNNLCLWKSKVERFQI